MDVDLNTLQEVHRKRIKNLDLATLDLHNASDSNSLALLRFLFPAWFVSKVMEARSPMILGRDTQYHVPRKVSSMGNGFTFELMTLVLTAIARTLDPTATVFGDDIIIDRGLAPRLIELLTEVGWVVNKSKSFWDGPFRESCGANYHASEGYIRSFDFLYPETIADCALLLNKSYMLREYPWFATLYEKLLRATPRSLRGGALSSTSVNSYSREPTDEDLPLYFVCDSPGQHHASLLSDYAKKWLHHKSVRTFIGFEFRPKEYTKPHITLKNQYHWAKYEMYLSTGGIAKDVITGEGEWAQVRLLDLDGLIIRESSLRQQMKQSHGKSL
jgi:hypothetical protein